MKAARINSEYVDVVCKNGLIIISEFNLKCVQCGCVYESKLIVKNGVHVCTDCIKEMFDFVERTEEYEKYV